MTVSMVTTTDNPYDPFTQYEEWDAFDQRMGYNTAAYVARVSVASPDLTPEECCYYNNAAVDEIVNYNFLGIYKKVSKEFP